MKEPVMIEIQKKLDAYLIILRYDSFSEKFLSVYERMLINQKRANLFRLNDYKKGLIGEFVNYELPKELQKKVDRVEEKINDSQWKFNIQLLKSEI